MSTPLRNTPAVIASHTRAASDIGIGIREYRFLIDSGLKWCCRCKKWLERGSFHNSKIRPDGLQSKCKLCSGRRGYKGD